MAGHFTVIADASVLVNFLVVNKVPLLALHSDARFLITKHVRAEITNHNAGQLRCLEQALAAGHLEEISVTDLAEVALFGQLTATGLGICECSAIAVAVQRQWSIAIDDGTARKRLVKLFPELTVLTTESLVVSLIEQGLLSLAEADALKAEWENRYQFKLPFASFAERVLPTT